MEDEIKELKERVARLEKENYKMSMQVYGIRSYLFNKAEKDFSDLSKIYEYEFREERLIERRRKYATK